MIPVSQPSITDLEKKYVNEALNDGWISSQGPHVKRFEEAWAKWNDVRYGVACSSGTTAIQIALEALNLNPGDEVIVPEFTMIATAWAVSAAGLTPVFVDCGNDLNIDVDKIEGVITKKTKVILPVHIYGRQCNMDAILDIAYEYNLRVIEDSAEAHGVKPRGDIACFSLFANKIISAGEGGICLTNDKHLAEQMNHIKAMAFNKDHTFLHKKWGHNFRMTNLQAAFALAQTERIDDILKKRKQIEGWYDEELGGIKEITLMPKRNVLWMYDLLAENRNELVAWLKKEGIESRVFFKPMSQQFMYRCEEQQWESSQANHYAQRGLYLPSYTDIQKPDIDYICDKIREFYDEVK